MFSSIAANFIVLLHVNFVLFVAFGGFFAIKWRRLAYLHLPAAVWGILIELMNWQCPLTPLEQELRQAAGRAGYSGGFIEHYLLPILYPSGLERDTQLALAVIIVVVNVVAYGWLLFRLLKGLKNSG